MGVLSDLVVAPIDDAERVAQAAVPSEEFDGIDIKGIDSIKFGTLHSILSGRSLEELLTEYEPVVSVSDDGPWVFRIPPELVSRIAALVNDEKQAVATQWARTEEFSLHGWSEADVVAAFDSIAALARKAVDSAQGLFLWMNL